MGVGRSGGRRVWLWLRKLNQFMRVSAGTHRMAFVILCNFCAIMQAHHKHNSRDSKQHFLILEARPLVKTPILYMLNKAVVPQSPIDSCRGYSIHFSTLAIHYIQSSKAPRRRYMQNRSARLTITTSYQETHFRTAWI